MKTCTKCGETKTPSGFYKNKSRCKACMDAEHADYKKRNAEKIAAYKAAWRLENIERIAAKRKRAYHSNADAAKKAVALWTQQNPELARANKSRWKKRNPAYCRMDSNKRRSLKLRATPGWANEKAILAIYEAAIAQGKHVDHIVPLRSKLVCGLHCEANLQLLTKQENLSKNNKHWPDMPE